ncbi:MAG TPA: threonine ammonia-lyase, partial [Vulgatibacter sp.]
MIGLHEVEEARKRLDEHVIYSPCTRSEAFSRQCGAKIWFKLENLQLTGSFKERGALNKLLELSAEERARGVITASAGNHAQGVAYHAGRLGIPATIVMPDRTPLIKVTNTRGYGAKVVLAGGNFDEAYAEARRLQEEQGLVFVHPFDDDAVIAGQGTIGLELLEQVPDLDAVIVPIGGGGLISGIAVALKQSRPGIRVIGVQTAALPSMKASVEAGEPVTVKAGQTIADGIAVKRPGGRTLEYVKRYVDEILVVDEEEIANAILLLLEREKTVAEGAAAVALAALLHGYCRKLEGENVALILSGGNIDMNLISRIIERGLVKGGRLTRFVVNIEDRPGSLARLTALVAGEGANI